MVGVSRLTGLCSSHLAISISPRVLKGMGEPQSPLPEMTAYMHMCACVFMGDRVNTLNIPRPLRVSEPLLIFEATQNSTCKVDFVPSCTFDPITSLLAHMIEISN